MIIQDVLGLINERSSRVVSYILELQCLEKKSTRCFYSHFLQRQRLLFSQFEQFMTSQGIIHRHLVCIPLNIMEQQRERIGISLRLLCTSHSIPCSLVFFGNVVLTPCFFIFDKEPHQLCHCPKRKDRLAFYLSYAFIFHPRSNPLLSIISSITSILSVSLPPRIFKSTYFVHNLTLENIACTSYCIVFAEIGWQSLVLHENLFHKNNICFQSN